MIIPRPQVEPLPAGMFSRPQFRLVADWQFALDDGLPIVIPDGFITDMASIPRLLWSVPGFLPTGPLLCGSIVHDFGYQHGYLLSPYLPQNHTYPEPSLSLREKYPAEFGGTIPVFIGRNQIFFDQILVAITIEDTGEDIIAYAARIALAAFGRFAWRRYRSDGPATYNTNSLGLPGVTRSGVQF
jgi:hypothetical protein